MQKDKTDHKKVQSVREMLAMRFRLSKDKASRHKKGKSGFFSSIAEKFRGKSDTQEQEEEQQKFTLKYMEKLGEDCLLIGNEYQLNAVGLQCMQDYTQAISQWQIIEEDLITNLFVSPKVRTLFVACGCKLHLYSYCLESTDEPPVRTQTLTFPQPILGIYIIKRAVILIYLQTKFQACQIEYAFAQSKITRKKTFLYFPITEPRGPQMEIIYAPEEQGNNLQIFFKDNTGTTIFDIFSVKIQVQTCEHITVGLLRKFCEVPLRYMNTLWIGFYRSDIYLVSVGLQLYAVRDHYFLDSITTNTSKLHSFIQDFNDGCFFLYHQERFDLYKYSINERVTPERFEVSCVDTIPLSKPAGSFFLGVKQLGQHIVFLFQQPKPPESNQLSFWLAVTDQIGLHAKIDKLYPSSKQIQTIAPDALLDKVKMALQIGFRLDNAYLQLWRRSGKTTKKDYEFLIATENYEMIAGEIEEKYKKTTLKFSQVRNVMESSLLMLREKVLASSESTQHLRQLSTCHFLLCKYLMWEKYWRAQGENGELFINIQDYYQLTGVQLVKFFFEMLGLLLIDRQRPTAIAQLRAMLCQFSLIFRLKYHDILPNIVKSFKRDLITLLQILPELLPIDATGMDPLFSGPWAKINLKETDDYLILQKLVNFENKKVVDEFIESKFFKVYLWHSHGALADKQTVIQKHLQRQGPVELFIILYEQLLLYRSSFASGELETLVKHIEAHYPLLPRHLFERFAFYEALYGCFLSYHKAQNISFMSQLQFLRLSEDQLFEIYFHQQRAKKGIFLLKEVAPIYQHTVRGGRGLFLASMFRFFQGSKSSWSDLKIVLNKFNNEKEDFHKQNYEVFEVMVRAILEKVRIGSQEAEAGLSEVLSYLQNIPFPLDRPSLLQSLLSIQEIHEQEQALKTIKINMTLRQILQNGEEVIFRLIEWELQRYKLKSIRCSNDLRLFAYKILAEVNYRRSNIYVDRHSNFPLKCFLIILMQDQALIPACSELLNDSFLTRAFGASQKLLENIVAYLYRKRLWLRPVYEQNKGYIHSIIGLLPEDNVKRRFLELSEIYAQTFSSARYKLRYPFFNSYYPTVDEIARVVGELQRVELAIIDYEQVFELIIQFKSLGEEVENIMETRRSRFANHSGEEKLQVMRHELYTVFFMRFMEVGLIHERALQIAAEIMAMDTRYKIYNIIVPVFLIQLAQKEMIAQVADPLAQLISYYFHAQQELQGFVNWLFSSQDGFSNEQLLQQFHLMREQKSKLPIFNPNNPLLSISFRQQLKSMSPEQQSNFNPLLMEIWQHVKQTREEFARDRVYSILFRLLLHDPYVLAEYINRKQGGINVCSFRAMLTLIGLECVFDFQKVLEFGQGVFSILMAQRKNKLLLEDLLEIYSRGEKYTEHLKYSNEYMAQLIRYDADDLIGHSILVFRAKLAAFAALDKVALEAEKASQLKLLLQDKDAYLASPLNYPFDDRDKQYALPEENLVLDKKQRASSMLQFDEAKERSQLCEHLHYLVKPSFRSEPAPIKKTVAQLYLKMNKKLAKKHGNKYKSPNSTGGPAPTDNFANGFSLPSIFPFFTDTKIEEQQNNPLAKSQSLKLLVDRVDEQNDSKVEIDFVDFLPEFKDVSDQEEVRFIKEALPLNLISEIEAVLQGKERLDRKTLPPCFNVDQQKELFEKIVEKVYHQLRDYPLLSRVQLIWKFKRILLGNELVDKTVEQVTLRLAQCELVNSVLYKIQDVFSSTIFSQEFSQETLLQLVRENMSDSVQHQEDMIKSAEIAGIAFGTQKARQSILIMFLVRLCRSYALEQDERVQNNLKDQIIFTQERISPDAITHSYEIYINSRNEDLRATARTMHYFRHYNDHHSHHLQST